MRFEVVFLYLYDIGRSVDLAGLAHGMRHRITRTGPAAGDRRHLDTPDSLVLPATLTIELGHHELDPADPASGGFDRVDLRARIYDEGVITVECRALIEAELEQLHTIRSRTMDLGGQPATMDLLAERHSRILKEGMAPYIAQDQYYFADQTREDYHIFCLLDPVGDPAAFVAAHRDYLAPFLLGENPDIPLHASQVEDTLKTPFSFTDNDLAIFDINRAFIIDPDGDYEDLLGIIEHANYQLLELRTLDQLLDRLLDDAEAGLRPVRYPKGHRGVSRPRLRPGLAKKLANCRLGGFHPFRALGSMSRKIGNLQPLRLDALFILENLENSSRIIGDYYLEQIYGHLCTIFNTSGWKRNVERRLEILQSIYTISKNDATDRTMVLLELLVVLMIGVEIVALFLPVFAH